MPLDASHANRHGDLLETCVRLQNLRTCLVGINQIRSVYMPIWKANKQEEIWSHFEDMLFKEQQSKDRVSQFYLMYNE